MFADCGKDFLEMLNRRWDERRHQNRSNRHGETMVSLWKITIFDRQINYSNYLTMGHLHFLIGESTMTSFLITLVASWNMNGE